jgi:hypothetical protein
MNRKWIWGLAPALVGVTVYAGHVLATPATTPGFKGDTVAMAKFGEIDSHVVAMPTWQEKIKTHGDSDLYIQKNTWDPSLCDAACIPSTGWHTHPGPSLVIVTKGSVTAYDGNDPTCTPHVYTAGTPGNSFIDIGGGAVHIIRNESGQLAETYAVQLIPAGGTRRLDADDPHHCPF